MIELLHKFWFQLFRFINRIENFVIREHLVKAAPIWIASFVAGMVTVVYSQLFVLAENAMKAIFRLHPLAIFISAPLLFIAGWTIVRKFAPNAAGSGIPQVMASIELIERRPKINVRSLLSLRVIITKIASSLLLVAGGAAIGREGPTIQISSSIFEFINRHIPRNWPRYKRSSIVVAGAAAGLAAAFNTPLGGIVFAIEELSRVHVRFFRSALIVAVIISGLTAQGFLGAYLYLGRTTIGGISWFMFVYVLLVAVVAGVLGGYMSKVIIFIVEWKRKNFDRNYHQFLYITAVAMIISTLAYTLSPVVLGSGKDSMQELLFSKTYWSAWYDFPLRYAGTLLSFTIGGAGGIFAPALSAGATLGGFMSYVFNLQFADSHLIVLAGMVAFLTSITRTPFTSTILVLEMTDRSAVIFYLLAAGLLSDFTARMIDKRSLYDRLKMDYLSLFHRRAQKEAII